MEIENKQTKEKNKSNAQLHDQLFLDLCASHVSLVTVSSTITGNLASSAYNLQGLETQCACVTLLSCHRVQFKVTSGDFVLIYIL